MAATTEIAWTDSTFNAWIGCQKVSAACDNCYAEALVERYGWTKWGPHGTRVRTSESYWKQPLRWHRNAAKFQADHGHRQRVFCCSLADVFDNRAPAGAREDLWRLIASTRDLDWLLLTKRPENIARFLPGDWGDGYRNVWLGTTTEDQPSYDRRWGILSKIPATARFISYEPACGPLRLFDGDYDGRAVPDWVIFGGESGRGARTCDPAWARGVLMDCRAARAAFFLKQHGTYESNPLVFEQGMRPRDAMLHDMPVNGKGGALLDGRLYRDFPTPHHQTDVAHPRACLSDGPELQGDLAL